MFIFYGSLGSKRREENDTTSCKKFYINSFTYSHSFLSSSISFLPSSFLVVITSSLKLFIERITRSTTDLNLAISGDLWRLGSFLILKALVLSFVLLMQIGSCSGLFSFFHCVVESPRSLSRTNASLINKQESVTQNKIK